MTTGPAGVRWGRSGCGCVWSWWVGWRVGVLPPVALTRGIRLAARVDRQLLQLLVSGPLADRLLPLLDPLQVALTLLVPVLPSLTWRAGARHLGGL